MKKGQLSIRSSSHSYTVRFINDVQDELRRLSANQDIHILLDRAIARQYRITHTDRPLGSLYTIEATERNKSLETVIAYTRFLIDHNIKKNHLIVVIGGGMVQDIGSFTAHILLRGIEWVFIPTTLLAMADSCIGSKSGINVAIYKNQAGAFHAPLEVLLYPQFLRTLPKAMIRDGMGEVIKHAIIAGGIKYRRIARSISEVPNDQQATRELIIESLKVKRQIVEMDEFEKGPRRVLNYGHTFGHALEGYTKNRIPHGVAVSIGMDMANAISWRRNKLTLAGREGMSRIIHMNIPYPKLPKIEVGRYMSFIKRDKKIRGNKLYAVLCRGIGKVITTPIALDRKLEKDIAWYVANYGAIRKSACTI